MGNLVNSISELMMAEDIKEKLGMDNAALETYNQTACWNNTHENDNEKNPFDALTLEELLFLREHGYRLPE